MCANYSLVRLLYYLLDYYILIINMASEENLTTGVNKDNVQGNIWWVL